MPQEEAAHDIKGSLNDKDTASNRFPDAFCLFNIVEKG